MSDFKFIGGPVAGVLVETTGLGDDASPMHVKSTCLVCGVVLVDKDFDVSTPENFERDARQATADGINTFNHLESHKD